METAEPELRWLRWNINWVGGQSTVLAKAEEQRLIKGCTAVVKCMRPVTFLQKKSAKAWKTGGWSLYFWILFHTTGRHGEQQKVPKKPRQPRSLWEHRKCQTDCRSPIAERAGEKRKEEGESQTSLQKGGEGQKAATRCQKILHLELRPAIWSRDGTHLTF